MEYTIGSLADLISGTDTPNKPKVVKVAVKQKNKYDQQSITNTTKKGKKKHKTSVSSQNDDDFSSVPIDEKSLKKKKKTLKGQDEEFVSKEPKAKKPKEKKRKSSTSENVVSEEPTINKIKTKKRKSSTSRDDNDDSEPIAKKAKNKGHKSKSNKDGSNLADSDNEENVENEKKIKRVPDPEEQERTIFVGNVPINITKKKMIKFFGKYGTVESVRFRGIPVADPKIPKKIAAIKKTFHPSRNSMICYIRFGNKEEAQEALKANGSIFNEHHLKVNFSEHKEKPDESKAIFIGNLSFKAEEEELWKLFESCGPISSVRIIRDNRTGMGKGFAYVNFQDADAVQLALEMENVKLGDRELRIKLSSANTAKKNKKKENKVNATRRVDRKGRLNGQEQNNDNDIQNGQSNETDGKTYQKTKKPVTFKNKGFQGSTVNKDKKKFKVNKGNLDKKRKIKQVAPY